MANGNCPIGAKHDAEIEGMRERMSKLETQQQHICDELTDLKLRKARLDGWSALLVALIAAAAAIAGPAVQAAIAAHVGK